MKLIGMLDSPYVRRTAISLAAMGIKFEHQALSVFNDFAEFQQINPAVKAPTLVLDNGETLMDSNLIIQYAESLVDEPRRLLPGATGELQPLLQVVSVALAACEKAVQLFYELNLRPPQKQHEPWVARVTGQLQGACALLEQKLSNIEIEILSPNLNQAQITAAVVWQFIQSVLADKLPAENYPRLQQLSRIAEAQPVFLTFPPQGPGTGAGVAAPT
jgi:glutathione S-transferase